ncbi:RusA family crossover junction endodeoxyribonuclease [Paenibacillus prosopidis]|uniref:Holliday junction resolvase RusA-like endonuclease n=1 Tax=Paenibacillus prosopidis TaxID=630520 RepID=A0A368VUE1_9BACL|nr:RusA family crossover junction endodeoxyribonuclease [Paenibacillus prosopidis]RCW44236.1 Holliday junction resolvase RusA-like endonuclease [Paenibacillus prosopidis]
MKITVDITPMGAVRMTGRGKFVKTDAQRYLAYKTRIGWAAREHIKVAIDGPVSVKLRFYYPIPKDWSKAKKAEAREGTRRPIVKPDIDNVVKGCFDALNGIAWKDDNRVVEESSSKWYSDQPRIEIEIEEVGA